MFYESAYTTTGKQKLKGTMIENTFTILHEWGSTRCIYFSVSIITCILLISIIYELTVIIA